MPGFDNFPNRTPNSGRFPKVFALSKLPSFPRRGLPPQPPGRGGLGSPNDFCETVPNVGAVLQLRAHPPNTAAIPPDVPAIPQSGYA